MKPSSAAPVLFALAALAAGPALAQGTTPDGAPAPASAPADPVLDALAKAKAQSEAKKAAADAEKAALESEKASIEAAAALKAAKNGTVTGPETKIDGTATVGTDGSKADGLLLSSAAALSAGRVIRDDLASVYTTPAYQKRPLVIVTSVDQLATGALTAFEAQRGYLGKELEKAQRRFQQIHDDRALLKMLSQKQKAAGAGEGAARSFLATASAISEGLNAASKIAGYFKTDYTFGALTIETAPELYADGVVQAIRREPLPGDPAVYATTYLTIGETADLAAEIGELHAAAVEVGRDHDLAVAAAAALRALKLSDPKAAEARMKAVEYEAFAAATAPLVEATNGFVNALFTATSDKPAPIVRIAQEREVHGRLSADSLALLVSGKPTAAYYTTKSLWTGIFGAPVHVMGGANVSYSLFDPKTGQVVTRGVAPVHGGYHNVRDVQKQFSAR
jgi:hypothetical protein